VKNIKHGKKTDNERKKNEEKVRYKGERDRQGTRKK